VLTVLLQARLTTEGFQAQEFGGNGYPLFRGGGGVAGGAVARVVVIEGGGVCP
jgi:hypothetical protein